MSTNDKEFQQKVNRFDEQNGLCYYCKDPMLLMPRGFQGIYPMNACTREHLDDRYDPTRGKSVKGTIRVVAACKRCNEARSNERTKALGKEHMQRKMLTRQKK